MGVMIQKNIVKFVVAHLSYQNSKIEHQQPGGILT